MIWLFLGLMLLAATLVVAWPLYRRQRRVTPSLVTAVAIVLLVSAAVYSQIGTPVPPDAPASIDGMVASLAARLADEPDNLNGWKMLGRSYVQLQRYGEAAQAFQRAVDLEAAGNAQTLADLGEAVILSEEGNLSARAAQLFENAVGLEPNNPKALFYGGIAAIERGNRDLAADRWEALLALAPPAEIQDILRQRVAEWRADEPPAAVASSQTTQETVMTVNVSLGESAAAAVATGATVFIIARDPDQPSPPIAAARRRVAELPASVTLGDADAMIPGRLLSAFERLEIVARVSASGQPAAQPGDWYGDRIVAPAESGSVDIVIERQVR